MTALFRPASVQGETAAYAPPVTAVPPEALADHYARIVAAHGEELKRHRRRERGGHLFSFLHGCTTVALAVALAALLPLKTIVPVFVHQHADGSFTSTISQY